MAIEILKNKATTSSEEDTNGSMSFPTKDEDTTLAYKIQALEARLAQLQAHLSQPTVVLDPMTDTLHLPCDSTKRHAMLRAMRILKLRRAKELLQGRLHGLRETQPYVAEERFVTRGGDGHCRRVDIQPFCGRSCSVRPLYDALLDYVTDKEILEGQRTLVEDGDIVESTLRTHRVVSTTDAGYIQDLNTAMYAEFVDAAHTNSSYGLIVLDSIDEDDLYPYVPTERIRTDITAAFLITHVHNDPQIIVLKSCVFVTIRQPPVSLPSNALDDVVASVSTWSIGLTHFLRERMAPQNP